MNIRPVSDLRNKFTEIEELVVEKNEEVYLTKNGYGSMVVVSMEKYTKLLEEHLQNELVKKYGNRDIKEIIKELEEKVEKTDILKYKKDSKIKKEGTE